MIRLYFLIAFSILVAGSRTIAQTPDTIPQTQFHPNGMSVTVVPLHDLVGTQLKTNNFHRGVFHDWHQLWQGRTAGFTAVRPGSDPHQAFDIRARGLHTFNLRTEPLLVVDGLPGVSMQSLDPTDIAEVNILRDGVGMARYGARGSAGVIEVKTHNALADGQRFRVHYRPEVGFDFAEKLYTVPSQVAFISFGGTDIIPEQPGETDWQKEVVRPAALNHAHHLTLAGRYHRDGVVQARMHYRQQQGILRGSQFDQLTGYLGVAQSLFQRKIQLTTGVHLAQRRSDLGFREAYRYAVIGNPTALVKSDLQRYEPYGGYVEQEIFDSYNPVAIREQNLNLRDNSYRMAHFNATWKIHPTLRAEVRTALDREQTNAAEYYSPQSRWRGQGRSGYGKASTLTQQQALLDACLNYDKSWKKIALNATIGHTMQDQKRVFDYAEATNIGDLKPQSGQFADYLANLDQRDTSIFYQFTNDDNYAAQTTRYSSLYGQVAANYNKMAFLSTGMRYEGASQLGPDARWAAFPYVEMGFDFAPIFKQDALRQLRLSASQATSGQAIQTDGLWDYTLSPGSAIHYNFEYRPGTTLSLNRNNNFGFERHTERAIRFDAAITHRYRLQMVAYRSVSTDLTMLQRVPSPPNATFNTYTNAGELNNRGAELTLNVQAISKADFGWDIGFVASRNRTTFTGVGFADTMITANLGSPGNCCGGYSVLYNGAPLGQFYGHVALSDQLENGAIPITDINGDGFFFPGDERDRRELTNARPRMEWGLHQHLRWRNWQAGLSLRGVLGHRMVNDMRYHYGTNSVDKNSFNRVITDYFNEDFVGSYSFSDYFIEKASFLRVQNVYITWQHPNERLYLTLGGNNILTFTNYSGLDPELRLRDEGPSDNGGISNPTNFVMGVDRRNSIPAVRSVFLTVGLRM
jgi:TonB-dependent starch-binding outer membrane protein SusC